MGELNLDAIKARADAATPGPWLAFGGTLASFGGAHNCAGGIPESGYVHEAYCGYEPMVFRLAHADAEFIAHARTDVPALLARVAELEAERDDYAARLKGTSQAWARAMRVVDAARELVAFWRRVDGDESPTHPLGSLLAAVDEFDQKAPLDRPESTESQDQTSADAREGRTDGNG